MGQPPKLPSEFAVAVIAAAQGKKKLKLQKRVAGLLDAGYKPTNEDLHVLADYFAGKFKHERGRPRRLFDEAYWRRKTVNRVRELERNPLIRTPELQHKKLSREQAIHIACVDEFARRQSAGKRFDDEEEVEGAYQDLCEQIRDDLRRAKKRSRPKKRST